MTAPLASLPTSTALRTRVRPAPPLEPPYDDEVPTTAAQLRVVGGEGNPVQLVLDPTSHLRLVGTVTAPDPDDFTARPTPRSVLPHPGQHATRLLRALLEVLASRRAITQLMPWVTSDVYADLGKWIPDALEHSLFARGKAKQSVRQKGTTSITRPLPPRLCSVRVTEPANGIAEVSAVLGDAQRARALVMRLEGFDGRWCCTLLQLL